MQRLLESYHLIDGGKIAHDLLTESIDIRMKLMAGLIDASQSYDVTCQSSVMCDGVLHLARGLGLSASIQSAAVVAISGRNLDRLALTHRPAGAVPHQPLANTFTIDKIDHADYYGFTLDGNGRCLLGSFIITHNVGHRRLFLARRFGYILLFSLLTLSLLLVFLFPLDKYDHSFCSRYCD